MVFSINHIKLVCTSCSLRVMAKNSLKWVLMVEPWILNVFIKIKYHFVKINLQSPTESYQLITFAICCWTGSGWKQLSLTLLHELGALLSSKLSQPFSCHALRNIIEGLASLSNAPDFHAHEKNVNNNIWHSSSGYLPTIILYSWRNKLV